LTNSSRPRNEWIRERALRLANEALPVQPVVWDNTTNYMSIERDHVIDLQGDLFLVRSNEHEGRFGIDDQPKFWVKHALALDSGRMHILKLVCREEFKIHVGRQEVHCCRSAEKEARVLHAVHGDARFMQGRTTHDSHGNVVQVIDFISGMDLLSYLQSIPVGHEEYSHALLPGILAEIAASLAGIQRLHDAGLCHGDIRNDHLLIERGTGCYKWIDFDLDQDSSYFDVWSAGNILHCVAAKGFVTFHDAIQAQPELAARLWREDASVFFPYRVMNLRKVYPYLPARLNDVLCRFSVGCSASYESMSQIANDLGDCAAAFGPADSPAQA
jgi:hypothetical protein